MPRRQSLTDEAASFDFIISLIYERCRIRLHDGKQSLIKARLGKRMRLHGFEMFNDYCDFLRHSADEEEITHVVDALTTNFTNFLREQDHFTYMVKTALPAVIPPGKKKLKVWSAACATGEEPFSIAFYLAEHFPLTAGWDWRILATDISTKALGKARAAVYSEDRLTSVPPEWQRRYLQRGHGKWEGHYRVKPGILERVDFQQLNLLGQYQFNDTFDLIFCRNVMIYFDRPTQEQLVRQLAKFLVPHGHLFTGHSESLNGLDTGLRCLKPSIYQKS
ncbi:MAG: protein-glutamate O-methyltransferase CheR [Pedosphaera sp.]|nr:protein-glutamate O-methyltransferase CheR [Pedosphaera sp.]